MTTQANLLRGAATTWVTC